MTPQKPRPVVWSGAHDLNFSRAPIAPLGICIHIMDGYLGRASTNPRLRSGTAAAFWSPYHRASAHFGIGRDGSIHQYVSVRHRPFAQGVPPTAAVSWTPPLPQGARRLFSSPNSCLFSVEHEGFPRKEDFGGGPWPDTQIEASAELCANLLLFANRVWETPDVFRLESVFGTAILAPPWRGHTISPSSRTLVLHSEIFPGKPLCPGPGFALRRKEHEEMTAAFLKALANGTRRAMRFIGGIADQDAAQEHQVTSTCII